MAGKRASTIRVMYGKAGDCYLDLVRRFPLRPLRSDADLDAAIKMVDELIDRDAHSAPDRIISTC